MKQNNKLLVAWSVCTVGSILANELHGVEFASIHGDKIHDGFDICELKQCESPHIESDSITTGSLITSVSGMSTGTMDYR